jgi:hypothetical protein
MRQSVDRFAGRHSPAHTFVLAGFGDPGKCPQALAAKEIHTVKVEDQGSAGANQVGDVIAWALRVARVDHARDLDNGDIRLEMCTQRHLGGSGRHTTARRRACVGVDTGSLIDENHGQ